MNKQQFIETYIANFLSQWAITQAYTHPYKAFDSNLNLYRNPPIDEAYEQAKNAWDSYSMFVKTHQIKL